MNKVSKPFYFGSYLVATLLAIPFTVGPLMAGGGEIKEKYLPFFVMGTLITFYAFVVWAVLIHKMWKAIPQSAARTTPGKAVGYLFIPVFNLYWWFQAVWGWSQDWNSYVRSSFRSVESEGKLVRVSEALPLWIAVFSAIGGTIGTIAGFAGALWIGTLLAAPNMALVPIFIFQVCDVLNSAPVAADREMAGGSPAPGQTGKRSLGIASIILGILSIFLPYIGLICGITAIVLARKQRRIFCEATSMIGLITGIIGTSLWALTVVVLMIALSAA
jgi:hypothetical protein